LGDELLGDELLGDELLGDELLGDPLSRGSSLAEPAEVTSKGKYHFDAEQLMPAGGWYLDELRTAVR
ncbi:MAG: hypothetical protein P1U77_04805, partial [Rubripirellula sp.]|nr:hypothetical protein [Rubripirellula sp.]